ncbi:MAG: hypothetical protein WCF67_05395 [Chitinophagaceae bacterium]
MEERVIALEKSLGAIASDLKSLSQLVAAGFTKVDTNFTTVQKDLKLLHQQVESLNNKVESLKGDTVGGFQDVGVKIENLKDEIVKIGEVTSYNDLYNNMKIIK